MFEDATIHNVVITTHTQCRLDLPRLARNCPNANYNPRRFAAVIIRLREPYTTALLFNTGKVVCTGANSVKAAHEGLSHFIDLLRRLGVETNPSPFTVENIVGASRFKKESRLQIDRLSDSVNVEYEPELFPGLSRRFKMRDGTNVMVIVFSSGKMIITGNRRVSHLREVMVSVNKWLNEYVREESAPTSDQQAAQKIIDASPSNKRSSDGITLASHDPPPNKRPKH